MGKTFQDLLNNGQARVLGIVSPVPMGNWLSTTQYQKLNLVRHNTATYIARTSNQNIEPGVADNWATYWMLICIDGGQVSPDGEYPEMSVGSVMHALLWGNKSYDGSSTQTITAADLGLADVYKPQGSIAFASLPATPNESNYGYVWNITNDFTTDSRFIEGAGKKYSAGTNVGVIEQDGVYYYDILGNFVDLSNYAQIDGNYQEMTVGQATNAQNAANVTSQIDGHDISDIFESDGTTVKEATQAETANSLTAVQIPNNADLNDYVGSEYWGKVFYATGEQAISNSPVPASYVFHLEVLRLSGNTVQVITAGSSSNNSLAPTRYFRYVSSNLSYGNWEEIVTSDGSYPTLGAGHLPNNYIYSGGTSDPKWYKIATITNAPNLAAASLLLSINGIFATQDNQYGAETGQIEFDAANAGGTYSCSATLNYGNINTNNVCVVQNGSTAELYYHFDSNYQAILVTAMSFYGGSTASYELTNVGVSARPSNAIYAVNRNVAAKVENALTIIKDGVSTVYDGSEAKTVEITENGGITVIEISANDSGTLTSEQLQQVKNNPQNTVLRRTVSSEMNEIYCFDSVNMTQGADSAYTFRNVTSMAQDSLTLQAIAVNLDSGLWTYSSVQTSAGGGGGSGITIVTIPQDGVSTNPVMSGTIELASPENTVIKIYNGEDNDGARYTYSILTSFDENASGDVPEYVYSGEDYIVTCKKSNGNTYNYTLTETPTPSATITYATDSDIEALFSGGGVTDELLGTWVLNDSPSILLDERTEYSVSFTSNSSNFTLMSKDYTRTAPNLIYGDMTVCSNNSWTNTAYKTITITDTSNLTNREAFTTWLKANATKQ